ncbi:class I fructose-bisphosphate aldolase [Marinobacter caseinilyticus]|uniref:class I fructose-bisphosphate aldolase n=1 Tax=Marinobacter caseinilyticus TaxID=2692195 RepID=UPI001407CCB0|nr:class I fructose-bisphosphate aldolase [Marinobacter caseinilyticus]
MSTDAELQQTIADMIDAERGILAADESTGTMTKRLEAVGVESTEENRRWYRSMLLSTPELGKYICGVIFYEETLGQRDDRGTLLSELAASQGVIPGIKVDQGKGPLPGAPGDMITYGLDGLGDRLARYKSQGARFAKWREVYPISDHNPTLLGLTANAEMLARYAAVCQDMGIVPIVEPEVLIDGSHSMDRAAEVNEQVWHAVFHALHRHGVALEHMILKPSMVTPGKEAGKASPDDVADRTLQVLRRTVPAAVPSINFLSGGQTPEEATANLNALNSRRDRTPWQLSMSFGRALQEPAMSAWAGNPQRREQAQQAFLKRARLNSLARRGAYSDDQEMTA